MKRVLLLLFFFALSTYVVVAQKPVNKLSNDLQSLVPGAPSTPIGVDNESSYDYLMYDVNGNILVNLLSKRGSAALISELSTKGISVKSSNQQTVTVSVSNAQLSELSSLQELSIARPEYKPMHGAVISQGDSSMRSKIARTTYGVNGAGVKVGVLSDSYNYQGTAATGVMNGELPGPGNPDGFTTPVQVVAEIPAPSAGSDEGRAMVEIIHDVAPGAAKAFATGYPNQAGFASNIIALKDAGCQVIVDDLIYFAEPFFQNGVIAQAVNTVKAAGVSYFSSAGNNSNKGYENSYQAGSFTFPGIPWLTPGPTAAHNFAAASDPAVYFLPLGLTAGRTYTIILQWDEPFKSVSGGGGAVTDLDLFYYNAAGTAEVAGLNGASDNIGGDPIEIIQVTPGGSGTVVRNLAISLYAGPMPGRLRIMILGNGSVVNFNNAAIPGINNSTTYGHANAAGAVATAAAPWYRTPAYGINPPVVESFSSRGGTPILFSDAGTLLASPVIYNKPEITAPDGGNNSFFGSDSNQDADLLPNFFGTSAAAPHAAAVAALMIESRHGQLITPDQIKTVMQNSCIDMDDPDIAGFQTGFDFRTGYGLLQADVAVAQVACPTITLGTIPAICAGVTSFTIPYTATTGSPTTYSISGVGITPVVDGVLPAAPSSITVNLSGAAMAPSIAFTLTIKNANDCSPQPIMGSVVVKPLPVVSITGTNPICQGLTTTLSPSTGGTWISNSPAIASVNNAGLVTGLTPGMATFTFTEIATGCSATTGVLTVKPTPTSALSASKQDVCPNTEVTLDAHCSVAGSTVNWNPGGATVTPNAPNTAYTYKASCILDGCLGNESSIEVRTHRVLVDLKNIGVGVQPKAIVGGVKDNLAPTNTISAPVTPRLWTIVASGCSASESAVFKLTGPVNFSSIDNNPPYAIFANVGSDYFSIDHPNYGNGGSFPNGTYNLVVDLRSSDGVGGPFPKNRIATGSLLATRSLQFTVATGGTRQGIEELTALSEENWVSIFQNPVSDEVVVRISGKVGEEVNLGLVNLQGQSLQHRIVKLSSPQQYEVLNVRSFNAGMYVLKATKGDQIKTIKVVKAE